MKVSLRIQSILRYSIACSHHIRNVVNAGIHKSLATCVNVAFISLDSFTCLQNASMCNKLNVIHLQQWTVYLNNKQILLLASLCTVYN